MSKEKHDFADFFEKTLKEFVSKSHDKHSGYSYAAGYLETMVVQMFHDLPRKKQDKYVKPMLIYHLTSVK